MYCCIELGHSLCLMVDSYSLLFGLCWHMEVSEEIYYLEKEMSAFQCDDQLRECPLNLTSILLQFVGEPAGSHLFSWMKCCLY